MQVCEQDDKIDSSFNTYSSCVIELVSLRHRFSLLRTWKIPKSSFIVVGAAASDPPVGIYKGDSRIISRAWLHSEPLLRLSDPPLGQSDRVLRDMPAWRSRSRGRRHANYGGGGGRSHGQVMRVACVLGTCQVQNLSHRLYQLIGQSGKEDSSPINPHSPHSYG